MKQRIVTGVIAGAAFLLLLWLGGAAYAALILLLAGVGYFEYSRMNGQSIRKGTSLIGMVLTLSLACSSIPYLNWMETHFEAVLWAAMLLLFAATVFTRNKVTIDHVALTLLGAVYIGIGFSFMIATRLGSNGLYWTLLLFVCIWATDSGAYFSGRAFGKRLLWPAISPKKTVEGAIGGIVISMVAALLFSLYSPELLPLGKSLWLGAVIAVVGQIGDLIQSAYKRIRNIKDTGAILPGHGGVLDRCDSWLIVFPFVHLLSIIPQ